jgi:hypothetical protein
MAKSRGYLLFWLPRLFIVLGLTAFTLLLIRHSTSYEPFARRLPRITSRRPPIPNIIHFVHMQRDDHAELNFSFESFLSVYSALRILNPSDIYIHTDFNKSAIDKATKEGSKWTRLLLTKFPEVRINEVSVSTYANGHKITKVEHRSDMVRFNQTYDKGGIYLDFDVLTLRDVRVLREAGFNNVVGRQFDGKINNGCFMTQKHSSLAYLMKRHQWKTYDSRWLTHSTELLTSIADRLVRSSNEVLIMEMHAMAPMNWYKESVIKLFSTHKEMVPLWPQVNDMTESPIERYENKARSQDWEIDFSSTYFLHAFHNRGKFKIPGFTAVSVDYILQRNSNYALLAWPIVQIGLKEGIFTETDV